MHDSSPVAVIVGGGGGIGQAIARAYARRGCRIALVDLDPARLTAACSALGDSADVRAYPCDIRDESACSTTVSSIVAELGGIDVLVQAAGLTQISPCRVTTVDVYRRVMEVNFLGVVAMTTAALPSLIAARGRIVVLSSVCGFAPLIGRTGYCASKYALHGFFETLRCEVKRDGVSVLMVCPSFVETDFATRGLSGDGSRMAFDRSTLGRPIDPDQLADMIVRAADRRRRLLIPSFRGRLAYWLTRLAPALYDRMMSSRFQIELLREPSANERQS